MVDDIPSEEQEQAAPVPITDQTVEDVVEMVHDFIKVRSVILEC
jgi:hypothetical protein